MLIFRLDQLGCTDAYFQVYNNKSEIYKISNKSSFVFMCKKINTGTTAFQLHNLILKNNYE